MLSWNTGGWETHIIGKETAFSRLQDALLPLCHPRLPLPEFKKEENGGKQSKVLSSTPKCSFGEQTVALMPSGSCLQISDSQRVWHDTLVWRE